MTRITSEHSSLMDMFAVMSNGNPEAAVAMVSLTKSAETIDPQSELGPFGPILELDSCAIYDEKIGQLYKYVCDKDTVKTHACLRAVQLGLLKEETLHKAINGEETLDVNEIVKKVQERLPSFAEGYTPPNL